MKSRLFVFSALVGISVSVFAVARAEAQINLDKPILVGLGDQIYESADEEGWYYFFPKELCRQTIPVTKQQSSRLFSDFEVGLCDVQIERVKAELVQSGIPDPKVRVFQGINSIISAMSLKEIYEKFDPRIDVLGDAGVFADSVPYRVSLLSGEKGVSKRSAANVMETLFGPDSIDAFVQVQFSFSAVFGGQPRECSSAVSVYLGRGPMPVVQGSSWPHRTQSLSNALVLGSANLRIEEDQITGCWKHPTPGTVCLR